MSKQINKRLEKISKWLKGKLRYLKGKISTVFRKKEGGTIAERSEMKDGQEGEVELPVIKLGPSRKWVIFFWILLAISIVLGIYNNFTAVDTETIIEKEIVEEKLKDTNAIESFVEEFVRIYHSWTNTSSGIAIREQMLENYLTEELVRVNKGMITTDCPTTASVKDIRIWSLDEVTENDYDVSYSVVQALAEGGNTAGEDITAAVSQEDIEIQEQVEETVAVQGAETENFFKVRVHMDNNRKMVIIRNPTACAGPERSSYAPAVKETDGSVSISEAAGIEEFLNTFLGLYPSASEKELAYYVKDGAIPAIGKDYIYAGLENAVYYKEDDQTKADVYVKYLDQETKTTLKFQYTLILEKGDNWKIVDMG